MEIKSEIKSKRVSKLTIIAVAVMLITTVIITSLIIFNKNKSTSVNNKHTSLAAKNNEKVKESSKPEKSSNTDTKQDLNLVDYDDIVNLNKSFNNPAVDNNGNEDSKLDPDQTIKDNASTSFDKSNDKSSAVGSSTEKAITNGKSVTIDESSETIKDESKQNEYKGGENQGPIEFFDVKPEKGADVKGDVPASGEHVGKWN
ncbi:hypothetical protein [Anaerocolumna chitinilytica]|uniref:Uncharacterized protein n=1 Tax=Anaerocolumna chitinilytica TaxID=1727145 RepID=A0A7I8DJ72_9FIRM|nr:hypothetical protein [Anaerocolumna chitinilytica]BCJ98410.1 hypothetical protein bsdcttw_14510 [Anaerocolumna chitinilytica]